MKSMTKLLLFPFKVAFEGRKKGEAFEYLMRTFSCSAARLAMALKLNQLEENFSLNNFEENNKKKGKKMEKFISTSSYFSLLFSSFSLLFSCLLIKLSHHCDRAFRRLHFRHRQKHPKKESKQLFVYFCLLFLFSFFIFPFIRASRSETC